MVSDISTGLIEFSEYKRLLFERIRHKLGDMSTLNNTATIGTPTAFVNITDEALSSLYIEAAETLDLYVGLNGAKITDDKLKMKWMGLYTTALAKETHARIIYNTDHMNGNVTYDWALTNYNNLLAESEREKDKLINLLNKETKK